MGDDRAIARIEDGVVIIRASALGMCVRALWASLEEIGAAASPEWLMEAAERGNRYEKAMNKKLRGEGYVIISEQEEVEYWVIPGKLKVLGHTDGVVCLPASKNGDVNHSDVLMNRLLEIKSMSPNVFKAWMADGFLSKPNNAWQLGVYMAATRLPAHYICVRAHEEANDLGQLAIDKHVMEETTAIDIRDITVPPRTEAEIKAKAMAVYKAWKVGVMLPCEEVFPCPFYFLHDEDDDPVATAYKEAPTETPVLARFDEIEDEVEKDAAEYVSLQSQIKDLTTRKDEIAVRFKGVGESMETPGYTITITEKRGRLAFDKDRLAADHPEIDMKQYEKRGKPIKALSVKER